MKIEVTTVLREIRSSKTGTTYKIQQAYAFVPGGKYPQEIEFFAPKSGVISPGVYILGPDAIYVSDKKLAVDASKLVAADARTAGGAPAIAAATASARS